MTLVGKDFDQFFRNCGKLSHVYKQVSDHVINMYSPDSKTLKKRKRSKEKEIVTAVTNPLQDTYKVPYLGDSRFDGTHKKKHKKYKSNDSSLDKDLDLLLNNYEKVSFAGKQVSDKVIIKMNSPDSNTLKKKKKSKEEIIPYVTDPVQNTCNVLYSENSIFGSTHKKKHIKNKSNDSSEGKYFNQFGTSYKQLSYIENQASNSVMKNMNSNHLKFVKEKIRKGKRIITAVTDLIQDANEVPYFYDSRPDSTHNSKCNDSLIGKGFNEFGSNYEKLYIQKQVSDHVRVNMNSLDKKSLKRKKSREEIITGMTDPVQNTYEVSYLDNSRSDRIHKKKHNRYRSNDFVGGKDLNQLSNCGNLSLHEKQVPDHVMINKNSSDSKTPKKKKSKEKEIVTAVTYPVQNTHEILYLDDSRSDRIHQEKHKKYRVNDSGVGKDLHQFVSDCGELSLHKKQIPDHVMINMNSPNSNTFKKRKKSKEKGITTAVPDPTQDEMPYLDNSKCDGKHKKYKSNNFLVDKDHNQLLSKCEKLSYVDKQLSDHVMMNMDSPNSKILKKKKRSKEKGIITSGSDPVQDEVPYLDDSRCEGTHKKKRKYKSNDCLEDKDLDQLLNNCGTPPYVETEVTDYNIIKKQKCIQGNSKHSTPVNQTRHTFSHNPELVHLNNFSSTKQNKSSGVIQSGSDLNDTRNSYVIKRDKFSLCASNNEKNKSDSSIHISDNTNIVKSKEPCKNAFEITENISKEDENLKENKSVDLGYTEDDKKLKENISVDLDFTEDDVDFEIPRLHAKENVKNLSEEEKKELMSQGVLIKTGKFTPEEDTIILKNIENFLKSYDNLDISEVLGIGRLKKDIYFTKFLKAKHFYAKLGKGLNDRTLISIYKRARRLIHPYKNKEKFQENEIKSLKFLRKVANKKWIYIGDTLERTEDKCLQAYRWHGKQISHGKWTKEEEQQLIAAIEKVSGSSDLSCNKLKGISWDEVATHIPTRNFSQCRMHWAFHLAWKPDILKHKWDKNCSKKLIAILKNEWYGENASEIDWLKVYKSFIDVAPSHIFLQKRWLYLRYQIKGYKTLSYKDTIDVLCRKYNITPNEEEKKNSKICYEI